MGWGGVCAPPAAWPLMTVSSLAAPDLAMCAVTHSIFIFGADGDWCTPSDFAFIVVGIGLPVALVALVFALSVGVSLTITCAGAFAVGILRGVSGALRPRLRRMIADELCLPPAISFTDLVPGTPCTVCLDKLAVYACYPCGHLCMCSEHAPDGALSRRCFVCQQPRMDIMRVFYNTP